MLHELLQPLRVDAQLLGEEAIAQAARGFRQEGVVGSDRGQERFEPPAHDLGLDPADVIVEHLSALFLGESVDVHHHLALLEQRKGAGLQVRTGRLPDVVPRREHHPRTTLDGGPQSRELRVPAAHPGSVEVVRAEGVVYP